MQWFEPLIIISAILFVISVFTYSIIQKRKQRKRIATMSKVIGHCSCSGSCGCCSGCTTKEKK